MLEVEYGSQGNKIDIYPPNKTQKHDSAQQKVPVVIFVHGGGWRRGDKGENPLWGHAFVGKAIAKEGTMLAVLPSYRLSRLHWTPALASNH
jgi:arylformamidase